MNIYQHVEIAIRELDSKLLLATLAASRGHQVIVSDVESIEKGLKKKILAPGIFHTKSLTPTEAKIVRHQTIINNGSIISSIDEEGGLVEKGYDREAKFRFSDQTIEQASTIFGWGSEDVETLKKIYPKHSSKIHKTGSPRADLWKSRFSDYWGVPKGTPAKPFLLVVSHMSHANYALPFHSIIASSRKGGQFIRDPEWFAKKFGMAVEHYRATAAFIEAIKYLSKLNTGYDIVLRPHPTENIESWKIFLEGIPNTHVIRHGSITGWVNKAFAVMHNGCTTGLEATVSGKPLVTYMPFQQEYGNEVSTELGYNVKNLEELSNVLKKLFISEQHMNQSTLDKSFTDKISKKIYIDNNELAAEKIIKIWESLPNANDELSKSTNWIKFKFLLKIMKFNGMVGKLLRSLFPSKFSKLGPEKDNFKFPPLDRQDITERISRLQNVLGIDKKIKIECKLLSERTILIKRS